MEASAIKKIAIYSDGDTYRSGLANLPFIRALRYHFGGSEIVWLSRQPSIYGTPLLAPLLTGMLTRLEAVGDPLAMAAKNLLPQARREKFDVLIENSDGKFSSWLLSHWVTQGGVAVNVNTPPPGGNLHPHRVGRWLAAIQSLLGGATPETRLRFNFKADVLDMAARILRPGYYYVALAPGGNGATRWPLEYYVQVAIGVAANGQVPIFLLGPEEAALQPKLSAQVPTALFPLQHPYARPYEYRYDFTIALLERCHIGLASDHLASELIAAADIPLLSLFGPTDPLENAPWTKKGLVLDAKQFGGPEMHRIPPVNVLHALSQQAPIAPTG
ncbi:MAG: glycosyltransferase family 9 protein [Candidatus Symbiobacter sp.]|nr:glycosyltransferase family 9 protein [Candidatus Symbiobacter sp.]